MPYTMGAEGATPQGTTAPETPVTTVETPVVNAAAPKSEYIGDQKESNDSPAQPAPTAPAKADGAPGQTTVTNWEERYKQIEAQRATEQKSYAELRNKLVSQGTERNQYQKQVEALSAQVKQLTEAFSKATEMPYDPDQFINDLKTQGPKFLDSHIDKALKAASEKSQAEVSALKGQLRAISVKDAVKERKLNAQEYPDFEKLEAGMVEVMKQLRQDFQAGLLGVDPDQADPNELVDHLYTLARAKHTPEALQKAEEHGAAKANAELAREAASAVAGGGKHTSTQTPDFSKMTLAEERAYLVGKIGEKTYEP